MHIHLTPCSGDARCVDCSSRADGLRPNLDRQPSCRQCEAERLALIELLLKAAEEPEAEEPEVAASESAEPVQRRLFG